MLKHAISPCRIRFAKSDFNFVAQALAAHGERCHLAKVWKDPEGLRELLDIKEVFRNLIDSPFAVQVSPTFYFYMLVRQSFLKEALTDANLADYVSQLLARRVSMEESDPLEDLTGHFTRVADFLPILSKSKGRLRRQLHIAAGNQFLILTGLYPEFLNRRYRNSAPPALDFYVQFAQNAFRAAECNECRTHKTGSGIYSSLAEAFPAIRRALNHLTENLVFLGS